MAKRAAVATKEPELFKTVDVEVLPPEKTTKAKSKAKAGAKAEPPAAKNAVAVREPKPRAPAKRGAGTVVSMIDPAQMFDALMALAINPKVDADKVERFIGMQERLMDRQARMAFDEAFHRMHPELPVITKDGRIVIEAKDGRAPSGRSSKAQNTQYAKWETIQPIIMPILHRHGFVLTHRYGSTPDGRIRITAVLKGYGWTDDTCYFDLPADTGGSKNNVQAWASSGSYGKRHTACAVLNIVTKNEDDDGQSAGKPVVVGKAMDADDVEQLKAYCESAGLSPERLVQRMNELKPKSHPTAEKLEDLPADRFDEAVRKINDFAQAKRQQQQQEGTAKK